MKERGFDFETVMWFYVRISALLMYLFALVALVGALVMGARTQMTLADVIRWTFMPNALHVQNTNLEDIAPWSTAFWKWTASAFVFFAASHGLHGVLSVIEDYLTHPGVRKALRLLVLVLVPILSGIGIYVLWTS
jgi:succinate dehydrogenase hydrophobic anchor subunit